MYFYWYGYFITKGYIESLGHDQVQHHQGTIHYGISSLCDSKICLSNIRPWNAHIKQFLSDSLYACHSSLLCFAETHLNSRYFKNMIELKLGWSDIPVLFGVDNNKDINKWGH